MNITEANRKRFWSKVDKCGSANHPNCWLWTAAKNKKGYGTIQMGSQRDGTRRPRMAHRVVWEMLNGPIPQGMLVLHHCDNPACVNPAHLWLGTAKDNSQDMIAKHRHGSWAHPERLVRGDHHPHHVHPELMPRGATHYCHTHPEKVLRGEAVGSAKLTTERVTELRRRYHNRNVTGETVSALAREFAIDPKTIREACEGRTWKHVPEKEEQCLSTK